MNTGNMVDFGMGLISIGFGLGVTAIGIGCLALVGFVIKEWW